MSAAWFAGVKWAEQLCKDAETTTVFAMMCHAPGISEFDRGMLDYLQHRQLNPDVFPEQEQDHDSLC